MATFVWQCTAPDVASCTAGVWVEESAGPLPPLTIEGANQIWVSAFTLWAVAWVFRILRTALFR